MSVKDYNKIAAAIEFIEANHLEQPKLSEIAAEVGLSEFHFQRVFTRFAGVSPKKFIQFLTAGYARDLLKDSKNVLDTAFEVGLSGGGRLHDLTIKIYAMTPGEIQRQGAGLDLNYGVHDTVFGKCLIATTERGICNLFFIDSPEEALILLKNEWPRANTRRSNKLTEPLIKKIFRPGPEDGEINLNISGSNFQLKVWEALLRIPTGNVISYGKLADRIDASGASRAVGTAVGKNPVSYLIPCHRVIRGTGAFGAYRWGSVRKKAMLGREAALSQQEIITQGIEPAI